MSGVILTDPVVTIAGQEVTVLSIGIMIGPPDTDLMIREELSADDGTGVDGWYTCRYPDDNPASPADCGFTSPVTCAERHPHEIIVWPDPLDPSLLRLAKVLAIDSAAAFESLIVPYERSMGPALSFYQLTPS